MISIIPDVGEYLCLVIFRRKFNKRIRSSELNAMYIHGFTQLVRQLNSERTVNNGPVKKKRNFFIFSSYFGYKVEK